MAGTSGLDAAAGMGMVGMGVRAAACAGGEAGAVIVFAAGANGACAAGGAVGLLSGANAAAISLGSDGPLTLRATYRYQAMNPTTIANPTNPNRSQNVGVSAGRTGTDPPLGRALLSCAGTCEGGCNALIASSAEGPECAKPGNRPAHPLQNMAFARLELPQASQTTDVGADALAP